MKILPITNNYIKQNKKTDSIVYSNTSFQAKQKLAKISLNELNDSVRVPIQKKISNMLRYLAENDAGFTKSLWDDTKNIFSKLGLFSTLDREEKNSLKDAYILSGMAWFVQNNKETFDNLVNSKYNDYVPGRRYFASDVERLYKSETLDRSKVFRKIGAETEEILYNYGMKKGALHFLKTHKDFLSNAQAGATNISRGGSIVTTTGVVIKKPEPVKKENIRKTETNTTNSILREYQEIVRNQKPFPSNGSEAEKVAWREIDEHRMALRRQLKVNNVSIVSKEDFPTNPLVVSEKLLEYLSGMMSVSRFNISSQMDVIGEYERYAGRYWFDEETGKSFIGNYTVVCMPIKEEKGNKEYKYTLAEKFINLAEKITQRDNTGMRDAMKVRFILEQYGDIMDEKLALRYIELLKKISFHQVDEYAVYYATKHLQGTPSIKKAMEEYHQILQEFPVEDNSLAD